MPEEYSLSTEIGSSTNVLIIDEVGEFVSLLVDSLLSRGFNVYYFGHEPKLFFEYLSHKKTFVYLTEVNEETSFEKIDYLYFFPKIDLDNLRKVVFLNRNFHCHVLIGIDYGFQQANELEDLSLSKEFVFKLVLFKDVFGPRVTSGNLGQIFSTASVGDRVMIEQSAEELVSPLYSDTLIKELLRVSFLPYGKGRIYLIKTEEINGQELVSLLAGVFPEVSFVLNQNQSFKENGFVPKSGKTINIRENVGFRVEETAEWFLREGRNRLVKNQEEPKIDNPRFSTEIVQETAPPPPSLEVLFAEKANDDTASQEVKPEEEKKETNLVETYWQEDKKKKKFVRKGFFVFLSFLFIFFCFFVIPMGLVLIFGINGFDSFKSTKAGLEKREFEEAFKSSQKAEKYFEISQKTLSLTSPFYSLIGLEKQAKSISSSISFSIQINQSLKAFLQTFVKITEAGGGFLKGESVDWLEVQRIIKTNYAYAYQQASLAQSSLKEAEAGFSYFKKNDIFSLAGEYLPEYRDKLLKGQSLALVLPEIVGVGGRKTYLVLFQNNLELRPTGGFIAAFGIVSLENGKLVNFEVHDIYEADNQLKGQVEPPAKIKTILGEQVWYFRDSNLDPEFSSSAEKALWFLDKEMNVSANGVIAVNLKLVGKTLNILGEIKAPDYADEISADNLLQKVIQYSETTNLDKGLNKQEFLVSLIKAVYNQAQKAESKEVVGLEGVVFSLLENKEILFYSSDENTEAQIADLGWDGNFRQYQNKVEGYSIYNDYFSINEANMGINKVNYFMDRTIGHEIKISSQGTVQEKLVLNYENKSPSENWPAGTYKNYARIYLPKGTKLISILKTDPENSNIWTPFTDSAMEVYEEYNKTVLDLLFEVPVKTKIKLEINYELIEIINLSAKINSYLLMVQKQPGAYSDNYNLIISFPENLIPLRVIPKAVIGGGKLLINEKLDRDRIFQIDLAI